MIDDELVRIWQSSPNQERAKFEKSRLIIEVQSNLDRVHKTMVRRDLMDRGALLIMIPFFTFYAFYTPFMLTKIASILTVLWSIYALFRFRKAKRNKPKTSEGTYLHYLRKSRLWLLDEKELLDTVLYWELIPFVLSTTMFFLGFMEGPHAKLRIVLAMSGGSIIVAAVAYYLNKLAVKTMLNPRLERVNKLIEALEQE
jgi:hypothetical protein